MKGPTSNVDERLYLRAVGTAGFEFNGPHAGLLFYRHLRASQRPYWQLWGNNGPANIAANIAANN